MLRFVLALSMHSCPVGSLSLPLFGVRFKGKDLCSFLSRGKEYECRQINLPSFSPFPFWGLRAYSSRGLTTDCGVSRFFNHGTILHRGTAGGILHHALGFRSGPVVEADKGRAEVDKMGNGERSKLIEAGQGVEVAAP